MKQTKFSLQKRIKSFEYALNGLRTLIREEHNAWIHLLAAICALILGVIFKITLPEWMAIIFAIGLVLSMEILNSVIEHIADFISQEKNEQIKKIKDLSAAGVLISSITAMIIGLIIFLPKIFN